MFEHAVETRKGRGRRRAIALVLALVTTALIIAAAAAGAHAAGTVWLCKPGTTPDPCNTSLATTVVSTDGSRRIVRPHRPSHRAIDCFYVYPTVSEQATANANLEIEPQETQIAVEQASRFSKDCRVYAPMYPQLTLDAINEPGGITEADVATAYFGVLGAFEEYLEHDNHGHGFVLIGHSQGAGLLIQLIKERIDPDPALRSKLVSAILLGGNVQVPEGKLEGGSFQNVPACQEASETHCVVAYSTFLKEPPLDSFFGRPGSSLLGGSLGPEMKVMCVNPAQLVQNEAQAAPLEPYASTTPFPGRIGAFVPTPTGSTPWVASVGEYTAQCHYENGASWLQVNPVGTPVDPAEYVTEDYGAQWGLHLFDVNIALGNLVKMVALQSATYQSEG